MWIYANGNCAGTPDWTGTVDELEDAGIEVEATPDTDTTFSARRVDPEDEGTPSVCSEPFIYWHSTTPVTPPPGGGGGPGGETPSGGTAAPGGSAPQAPRLRTVPAGRANDNTPRVTGSAPGAATVKIFAKPNCGGAPWRKGSAAELAAGLEVQVADNTTTAFSAVSRPVAASRPARRRSPTSRTRSPPRTRITMGPGVKTRTPQGRLPLRRHQRRPAGNELLLQGRPPKWKPCSSPFKLKQLGLRRHTLRVKAVDPAGNAETKGAKRSFKVVRAP